MYAVDTISFINLHDFLKAADFKWKFKFASCATPGPPVFYPSKNNYHMARSNKIKNIPKYQFVKWKQTPTSRGIKHKQVRISQTTPRSFSSTPSRNAGPSTAEPQDYMDANELNPPVLPSPKVGPHALKTLSQYWHWSPVSLPMTTPENSWRDKRPTYLSCWPMRLLHPTASACPVMSNNATGVAWTMLVEMLIAQSASEGIQSKYPIVTLIILWHCIV